MKKLFWAGVFIIGFSFRAHATDIPKAAQRFHAILTADNWETSKELPKLIEFPVTVTDTEYQSEACDKKCDAYQFPDFASLKPVLSFLHDSWAKKPEPGYEQYAPSPFRELAPGHYGVYVQGDCEHFDKVGLNRASNKVARIDVDGADLANHKTAKKFRTGPCNK